MNEGPMKRRVPKTIVITLEAVPARGRRRKLVQISRRIALPLAATSLAVGTLLSGGVGVAGAQDQSGAGVAAASNPTLQADAEQLAKVDCYAHLASTSPTAPPAPAQTAPEAAAQAALNAPPAFPAGTTAHQAMQNLISRVSASCAASGATPRLARRASTTSAKPRHTRSSAHAAVDNNCSFGVNLYLYQIGHMVFYSYISCKNGDTPITIPNDDVQECPEKWSGSAWQSLQNLCSTAPNTQQASSFVQATAYTACNANVYYTTWGWYDTPYGLLSPPSDVYWANTAVACN
jgi:hypothetical protein